MKLALPNIFVIYDLEYTSWEGAAQRNWSGPGEHREVIQIGAVRVDAGLNEVEAFLEYVRPHVNPRLSGFITGLTGVTQRDVDNADTFCVAMNHFARFCGGAVARSWGRDHAVLFENAALSGMLSFPMWPIQFADIRHLFFEHGVPANEYMSSTIPKHFGLEPPPSAHDALNDARSILMALRALRNSLDS